MSAAAEAWERFVSRLTEAGGVISGPIGGQDAREVAEGYRHLTRALSIAIEMWIEKGDPLRPEFTSWMNPHRKILGDNPGTEYHAALVSPGQRYRISGNVGETAYVGIAVHGTGEGGGRRLISNVDDVELDVAPDGSFSHELADLPDDATDILVRSYYHQPDSQVHSSIDIECLGAHGRAPALTEDEIAARLDAAGEWALGIITIDATLGAIFETTAPEHLRKPGNDRETREVDWDQVAKAMPTPAIAYHGAWFDDLDDDEAIVATGTLPECRYASFQWLSRWMESGDYRYHRVALTDRDLVLEADGSFRVLLAHRDPGSPNWLDATGMRNGTCVVRILDGAEPIEVTFERIRLAH